jgi:hypothetical protein
VYRLLEVTQPSTNIYKSYVRKTEIFCEKGRKILTQKERKILTQRESKKRKLEEVYIR